jgi:hypothetical protein
MAVCCWRAAVQIVCATILIARQGQSETQMPQSLL